MSVVRRNYKRIEQVMINFLANACQATDGPSKPILIEIENNKFTNEAIAKVTDKDEGVGPSHLKQVTQTLSECGFLQWFDLQDNNNFYQYVFRYVCNR